MAVEAGVGGGVAEVDEVHFESEIEIEGLVMLRVCYSWWMGLRCGWMGRWEDEPEETFGADGEVL